MCLTRPEASDNVSMQINARGEQGAQAPCVSPAAGMHPAAAAAACPQCPCPCFCTHYNPLTAHLAEVSLQVAQLCLKRGTFRIVLLLLRCRRRRQQLPGRRRRREAAAVVVVGVPPAVPGALVPLGRPVVPRVVGVPLGAARRRRRRLVVAAPAPARLQRLVVAVVGPAAAWVLVVVVKVAGAGAVAVAVARVPPAPFPVPAPVAVAVVPDDGGQSVTNQSTAGVGFRGLQNGKKRQSDVRPGTIMRALAACRAQRQCLPVRRAPAVAASWRTFVIGPAVVRHMPRVLHSRAHRHSSAHTSMVPRISRRRLGPDTQHRTRSSSLLAPPPPSVPLLAAHGQHPAAAHAVRSHRVLESGALLRLRVAACSGRKAGVLLRV